MKPTNAQLNLLYRWFSWKMPLSKARNATKWLEENADRKATSLEIKRVGDLYHKRALDEEECFNSPIWDGYPFKSKEVSEAIIKLGAEGR